MGFAPLGIGELDVSVEDAPHREEDVLVRYLRHGVSPHLVSAAEMHVGKPMRDEVAQVVHPATKVLGLLGDTVVLGERRCGGVVHDVLDRDARELNDLAYESSRWHPW